MSENGQLVIAAIREQAAARPDFIWQGACEYVVDNKPGCLVGHGLWAVGLIDAQWAIDHDWNNGLRISGLRNETREWGFDRDEIEWLGHVQNLQDAGATWESSIISADSN